MVQQVGKIYKALVFGGLFCILVGILLPLLYKTGVSRYMLFIGYLSMLAGTCLVIFQPANHPRYYRNTGGISIAVASRIASMLVLFGGILRLLHWEDSRYFVNAGFVVYVFVLIRSLAKKAADSKPARLVDVMKLSDRELNTFTGIFINMHLGMEIRITDTNNELMAQASNQSAFPLTAIGPGSFEYNGKKAKIVLVFEEGNDAFLLKQNGGTFPFERQIAG